jgi:hypothetical protein
MKAFSIHTINIISQQQYFAAHCLSSCVGNVFCLHSICVCFPSTKKLVMWEKCTVWLVSAAVHCC